MKVDSFLIVDDNSVTLGEIAGILKQLGYKEVHETKTGSEAWATLRIKEFSCVISAWEMPEMSGLALLKVVRNDERYATLPFFLSDSAFTKGKVINAGRAGVTGLIVKPYDLDTINEKIKSIPQAMGTAAPTEEEISLNQGMKLLEANDHEGALRLFQTMLSEGESAEVYYNIGYIKTAQGEYPEAIEAFRKATQLDRLFAKAYEAMGRAYKALGQPEKAEESLSRAAEIYLSSEKEEDAEEVLNEILEVNPETINVYNNLGVVYRRKGDYETALKHYEKALRIHPEEPNIYYNIGRIYVDMKNSGKAKSHFEKAVALDPNFDEARKVLNAIQLGTL